MVLSMIKDVGRLSISGGSFSIVNQENRDDYGKFANYLIPEAFHDAAASSAIPKCYPGTRETIMRDLICWVENGCCTHPIYHLYAPVGSGKTAIAKTLADLLCNYEDSSQNSLLATFFFSRATDKRSSARGFIATIAYQVAKNIPSVKTYIMEAVNSDPAIFEKDIFVQMRSLLLHPLRKACAAGLHCERATSDWPRLFVVDGLDECQNIETQVDILKALTELARFRPFHLAILLTCRNQIHIRNAFSDPHLNNLTVKADLSSGKYHSECDIRIFLESKFKEIRLSHRGSTGIRLPSNWPGPEVIDTLIRKSSGHFIYPSVVIKYVGALDDDPAGRLDDALERSKVGTDSPSESAGELLFRQLDDLYSQILGSIKREYLPTIINAFSFALVPYGGAMLLDEPKTRARLANLQGILISVLDHKWKGRRDEIAVAFLHSSFSDFLLDPARSGLFYIERKRAHAEIAVYLFDNYIENNPGKESSARAIYSFITHLRMASATKPLRLRFIRMCEATTYAKIFKNCNRPDDLGLSFDVWRVLQSLASAVGQVDFKESPILERDLRKVMKSHLHQELKKYAREPLNQLIALLMCGARFPQDFLGQRTVPESSAKDALIALIREKFDFPDVCPTDQSSLNLLLLLKVDQASLRGLVSDMGYEVDPGVCTAACINALKCLLELSRINSKHSPVLGGGPSVNLSAEFDSFRQATETVEDWWWLDSIPLASLFTHFFTDFVVRLLEHAAPSVEIADYLDELEDDIKLLRHCANRVNMHGVRYGKELRAIIRRHQTVNDPPSLASSFVVNPNRQPELSRMKTM